VSRLAVTVPDIGMESEEITFGAWLKSVGDSVVAGEDLFEVEADKATVICEALAGGRLSEVAVSKGVVKTGDVVGYLDAG